MTTALMLGFSRCWRSSRTRASVWAMSRVREVQEPVHAPRQLHERAEVGEPHYLARHARDHRIALGDRGPGIGLDLLEAQRDPLVVAVDVQDLRLDVLAFLENFRRMPDIPGPGHVRNVQERSEERRVGKECK